MTLRIKTDSWQGQERCYKMLHELTNLPIWYFEYTRDMIYGGWYDNMGDMTKEQHFYQYPYIFVHDKPNQAEPHIEASMSGLGYVFTWDEALVELRKRGIIDGTILTPIKHMRKHELCR